MATISPLYRPKPTTQPPYPNPNPSQCSVFRYTRLSIVLLCSGIMALIEAPSQLQVMEPHLQKRVDVTCCTQVCQANECVLEEKERHKEKE